MKHWLIIHSWHVECTPHSLDSGLMRGVAGGWPAEVTSCMHTHTRTHSHTHTAHYLQQFLLYLSVCAKVSDGYACTHLTASKSHSSRWYLSAVVDALSGGVCSSQPSGLGQKSSAYFYCSTRRCVTVLIMIKHNSHGYAILNSMLSTNVFFFWQWVSVFFHCITNACWKYSFNKECDRM